MRVLMLGWEFPPFITGGLGTACFGLTKALDRRGTEVTFVLPKHVDPSNASHVHLISPGGVAPAAGRSWPAGGAPATAPDSGAAGTASAESDPLLVTPAPAAKTTPTDAASTFARTSFLAVPAEFSSPYPGGAGAVAGAMGDGGGIPAGGAAAPYLRSIPGASQFSPAELAVLQAVPEAGVPSAGVRIESGGGDYSGDLVAQAQRYALFCAEATAGLPFDVIHAHDWLTYPAGMAIARITGRPLVVHVHSTEFDRSGEHVNQRIYDIERRGMHAAIRVIAVSALTRNLCINRYGVHPDRITIVYNGVDLTPQSVGMEDIQGRDKIVLYFGRITMQKGPEYFIHAAKRVLDVMQSVKFVVAGSGDQAQRMIELAAQLGIGKKVLFTGFLRGRDIQRVFSLADLYVMPSVSEPFGIAPLEAMSHDVPVLISKTSGVSEVLTHALKVDFWDVDDIANKIVAVLRHPPLSRTLLHHGRFEVRRLTWDGAAERCIQAYTEAINAMRR